jgi:hypothetical protein
VPADAVHVYVVFEADGTVNTKGSFRHTVDADAVIVGEAGNSTVPVTAKRVADTQPVVGFLDCAG